jgi:hypothetical protein
LRVGFGGGGFGASACGAGDFGGSGRSGGPSSQTRWRIIRPTLN